ncbi:MAG: hypothetical protein OIF50_03290 [Flavobacteriaceae bacterium]|nr:hypothetical protein [Flavobacteriaceae bacterium]
MRLLYKNDYASTFKVTLDGGFSYKIQLVIDNIGVFYSETDLIYLLEIVRDSHKPCNCKNCKGKNGSKIWTTGTLADVCFKIDPDRLKQLEDAILGTQFMLQMDATLEKNQIQ